MKTLDKREGEGMISSAKFSPLSRKEMLIFFVQFQHNFNIELILFARTAIAEASINTLMSHKNMLCMFGDFKVRFCFDF